MTSISADIIAFTSGVAVQNAAVICAVIHGRYGAPEAMMDTLVRHLTAPDVHYVLPRAAGNAWYSSPTSAPMTDETLEEISRSLEQIRGDIAATMVAAPEGVPLVVGGFSQGACMTIEHVARDGCNCDAFFALTGCRVGAAGNPRPIRDLDGLEGYVSTGSRDPFILLPEYSETLHGLAHAGGRIRADMFPRSDHVMSQPEIATVDSMLRRMARREPLLQGGAV